MDKQGYDIFPHQKELAPDWVASLARRDAPLDGPIVGTKEADTLKFIGMPVGGIGCGTVYLNGDGRLFVWDIFNQHHEGVVARAESTPGYIKERDGANYVNPPTITEFPPHFQQGFGLALANGAFLPLNGSGWDDVCFEGKWPIANVAYQGADAPVTVTLNAFSPFIPMNVADSSLPVTVMEYTVRNTSTEPVAGSLCGWLENPLANYFDETTRNNSEGGICYQAADAGAASICLQALASANDWQYQGHPGLEIPFSIAPGESRTVPFVIAWYLPNTYALPEIGVRKRHYAARFANAFAVATHVADNYQELSDQTRLWVRTWNDSTLPQWLLDRSILTLDTLQTANCLIFENGQFWAWEGVGACEGTCTHVWHYAQSMARLFPALERNLREVTDFGFAQQPDGGVPFRGVGKVAIDGQCATVLRSYREHLISADGQFLRRNWSGIKRALNFLIAFDRNDGSFDGLLDGEQHNTLDAEWFGKVHALCSLYLAALRSGEVMAREVADTAFEALCRSTYEKGRVNIEQLFNGEFYEQIEDPEHADAIGVGKGCYIDQVIGQFWAYQVGLGRLYNAQHIRSALDSLWRYNFLTDVGPFREVFTKGRPYALAGEGGLLMCTWPKGGLRDDYQKHWQYGYFNECMSGFEYQVAAHMISEGDPELVTRGLAIARTIHDRYAPAKRNPYNEIECSDHYARAMASYGVFLAVCGFEYDGPHGCIGFAPRVSPETFKAAFTAAEGWGSFSQERIDHVQRERVEIVWGKLRLRTLSFALADGAAASGVDVVMEGKAIGAEHRVEGQRIVIDLAEPVEIGANQTIAVEIWLRQGNTNP